MSASRKVREGDNTRALQDATTALERSNPAAALIFQRIPIPHYRPLEIGWTCWEYRTLWP
jgi:hypothetical protein